MLSKNKIKFIRSLEQKKYRRQEGAFIAEGPKCVGDLLYAGFTPLLIVATEDWKCTVGLPAECEQITTSKEELKKASLLLNPQQVICVFRMQQEDGLPSPTIAQSELVLCLDGIQDPGNLGTIIRTADWFGIKNIVCSNTTADAFAPKVVQATMGSIARERIFYADIPQFLGSLPAGTPVYGTFLNGESIYDTHLEQHGIIVMGNEGNGISDEVGSLITHRILIPPYPADKRTAESLNVSIATSIVCSEFRSRTVKLS